MVPNIESVYPKIIVLVWLCYVKKKMTIIMKIKEQQGAEGRHLLHPHKAHPTSEFVIVAKFSSHVLHHLASSLSNVVRQVGRLTKKLSIW